METTSNETPVQYSGIPGFDAALAKASNNPEAIREILHVASKHETITQRKYHRPVYPDYFVQGNYPYGYKKCLQMWYIESKQTKNDPVPRDRVITRTTPKLWNEKYTDALRSNGELPRQPSVDQWNNPQKNTYHDFTYLVLDFGKKPGSVWVEVHGLLWYGGLLPWFRAYVDYYWYMDRASQEKFEKCIRLLYNHRRDDFAKLPRKIAQDDDIGWNDLEIFPEFLVGCVRKPREEGVGIFDWLEQSKSTVPGLGKLVQQ